MGGHGVVTVWSGVVMGGHGVVTRLGDHKKSGHQCGHRISGHLGIHPYCFYGKKVNVL